MPSRPRSVASSRCTTDVAEPSLGRGLFSAADEPRFAQFLDEAATPSWWSSVWNSTPSVQRPTGRARPVRTERSQAFFDAVDREGWVRRDAAASRPGRGSSSSWGTIGAPGAAPPPSGASMIVAR